MNKDIVLKSGQSKSESLKDKISQTLNFEDVGVLKIEGVGFKYTFTVLVPETGYRNEHVSPETFKTLELAEKALEDKLLGLKSSIKKRFGVNNE